MNNVKEQSISIATLDVSEIGRKEQSLCRFHMNTQIESHQFYSQLLKTEASLVVPISLACIYVFFSFLVVVVNKKGFTNQQVFF